MTSDHNYDRNLADYMALPPVRSGTVADKCPLIFSTLASLTSKADILKMLAKSGSDSGIFVGMLSALCPIMDAGRSVGVQAVDLRFLLREVQYALRQLAVVELVALAHSLAEQAGNSAFAELLIDGVEAECGRHTSAEEWHYEITFEEDRCAVTIGAGPDPRGKLVE